ALGSLAGARQAVLADIADRSLQGIALGLSAIGGTATRAAARRSGAGGEDAAAPGRWRRRARRGAGADARGTWGAFAVTVVIRIACGLAQCLDILLVELHEGAALEAARQQHCAVADGDQPAHSMAHRFEHAPHLAVAAFGNRHAVPAVRALAA